MNGIVGGCVINFIIMDMLWYIIYDIKLIIVLIYYVDCFFIILKIFLVYLYNLSFIFIEKNGKEW